jgi:flagellar basal body-associated protein FliL
MNQENKVPEEVKKKNPFKLIVVTISISALGVCGYLYFSTNETQPKQDETATDTTIVVNEVSPDSAVKVIVADTTKNDSVK